MGIKEILPGIYWVGTIDWDRRLFDEIVSTPHGTSYNSYLITDEKNVLIDTTEPYMADTLITNIRDSGIERLDYIVANHAEQDHSGTIPRLLEMYPEARVVTNPKCKELLKTHIGIPEERIIEINESTNLKIGRRTLRFIYIPWTHWPETMATYIPEDDIIFTCDLFGSHLATSHLFSSDVWAETEIELKRYYSEIMMPFRLHIKKYIGMIRDLNVKYIAPSHGPVHDNPNLVLDTYEKWVSDEPGDLTIIAYVSMHGSTKGAVSILERELLRRHVPYRIFNLTHTDPGEFAMALVDARVLVFATPTMLAGAHPSLMYFVHLTRLLRPKAKYLSIINSFGWGGMTVKQIEDMLSILKMEKLPYIQFKGMPSGETERQLVSLAEKISEIHKGGE